MATIHTPPSSLVWLRLPIFAPLTDTKRKIARRTYSRSSSFNTHLIEDVQRSQNTLRFSWSLSLIHPPSCRHVAHLRTCISADLRRNFSQATVSTILLPPVVFAGLLVTLWTYKCLMMIVFQNRIIYMPSMPPFSRSEKVSDYERQCRPVQWIEKGLRSLDGTSLAILEGSIPSHDHISKKVIIVYFQGNGSSTPPRIPELSQVLIQAQKRCSDTSFKLLALSYRGYWKSRGRPSQRGIEMDAQALLSEIARDIAERDVRIVLWGQSIGAGVATTALATWLASLHSSKGLQIDGLLLETPFTGLKSMLMALYPQKYLPYRYLGPFLMSHWDSVMALHQIGPLSRWSRLKCLLLEAGSDELVPVGEAQKLFEVCKHSGIEVQHEVVEGAFHTNIMNKPAGRRRIVDFLEKFAQDRDSSEN